MFVNPMIKPPVAGLLWMLGAISSFTLLALSGRELSSELNVAEIMVYRSGISLVMVVFVLAYQMIMDKEYSLLHSRIMRFHVLRNIIHYVAQYSWFYSLALLPLIEITAIEFSAPIWTVLLATLFLREKLTRARSFSLILGFSGILVILRPGSSVIDTAALLVLFAAFCYASVFVITKYMTKSEKPLTILFYMFLIQLIIGLQITLPEMVVPRLEAWPWIMAVSLSGLAAHYFLARAFIVAEAGFVIPIDFLRLPLIGLAGWVIYQEIPDSTLILGVIFILSGIWINRKPS